jgi:hypothetical protein
MLTGKRQTNNIVVNDKRSEQATKKTNLDEEDDILSANHENYEISWTLHNSYQNLALLLQSKNEERGTSSPHRKAKLTTKSFIHKARVCDESSWNPFLNRLAVSSRIPDSGGSMRNCQSCLIPRAYQEMT